MQARGDIPDPGADRVELREHVILFLGINIERGPLISLETEVAEIYAELQMASYRDDFRLEARWAATADDVMRHLNLLKPTIVHFSCHGAQNAGLMLRTRRGDDRALAPGTLANMIATARRVRLLVLSACYGDEQLAVLRPTVESVIGMAGSVADEDARAYAVGFYRALASRKSLGAAHRDGITTADARRGERGDSGVNRDIATPENTTAPRFTPTLLTRGDKDPNQISFVLQPPDHPLRVHRALRSRRAAWAIGGVVAFAASSLFLRWSFDWGPSSPGTSLSTEVGIGEVARYSPSPNTIVPPVRASAQSPAHPARSSIPAAPPRSHGPTCWAWNNDLIHPMPGPPECGLRCRDANDRDRPLAMPVHSYDHCESICICEATL